MATAATAENKPISSQQELLLCTASPFSYSGGAPVGETENSLGDFTVASISHRHIPQRLPVPVSAGVIASSFFRPRRSRSTDNLCDRQCAS
jgi:hypothetical protein